MGRLVGVPHFFTEESHAREKDIASDMRKARKMDDDGEALLAVQIMAVRESQAQLVGNFLRRTTESRTNLGALLIPLPPYVEIIGVITLTDREVAIIAKRKSAAQEL